MIETVSTDGDTMSQWNWFKYKLKRRLNRNHTKEAEMYWEFIANPVYESLKNEIVIAIEGISIPEVKEDTTIV